MINLVVSLARPQSTNFWTLWSKQQPFLCFLYITTNSWIAVCVCAQQSELVIKDGRQRSLGRCQSNSYGPSEGQRDFPACSDFGEEAQRTLKPSHECEQMESNSKLFRISDTFFGVKLLSIGPKTFF